MNAANQRKLFLGGPAVVEQKSNRMAIRTSWTFDYSSSLLWGQFSHYT